MRARYTRTRESRTDTGRMHTDTGSQDMARTEHTNPRNTAMTGQTGTPTPNTVHHPPLCPQTTYPPTTSSQSAPPSTPTSPRPIPHPLAHATPAPAPAHTFPYHTHHHLHHAPLPLPVPPHALPWTRLRHVTKPNQRTTRARPLSTPT